MTTRANTSPVHVAECRCGGDLLIFQARGKRAYLYSRCAVCGLNQRPHDGILQALLWHLIPEAKRADLPVPLLVAAPDVAVCPCCGRAAA